jgi:adenylate cyclase
VTGFVLTDAEGANQEPPASKASVITSGDDPTLFLPNYSGVVRSLPELEAAATGNGALNIAPERDGVVRRVQLLIRSGDTIYPTLTAEAIRVGKGGANYLVKSSGASGESRSGGKTGIVNIRIGDVPVATDSQGGIWLHYTKAVAERSFPIWRLLEDELTEKDVSGNIIFIGTSAAGLKDLRFNALGEVTAGAEMHTQAVEQILQGTYLKRPDWAKATEILFMFLMWGALVVLIFRYGAIPAALAGMVVGSGTFVGSWLAFSEMQLLLDPVTPGAMALAVYLVCSVSRQLQTEREKRWIRGAFASYISPNLVRYLIDNPGELELGGERRECSFVMTDLAGFTSLVERSEPEQVLALLNEYLDGMIAVALRHEGTIDRIVGDAVAVIFSAPVLQPDHGQRAVDCALEMDEFANGFRLRKQAEGTPIGIARVGVNTGRVTIGNVGGKRFVDYRALGDAVNTAARLETVNGQLGTRICVSGSTVALCPQFVGRPVGSLVLKGKSVGIDAYEPLTAEAAGSPAIATYLAAYELLEQEDPEAERAFAALLEDHPDDPLAKFHLKRLRQGDSGTTVVLTSK